jgi:hypothetical protein
VSDGQSHHRGVWEIRNSERDAALGAATTPEEYFAALNSTHAKRKNTSWYGPEMAAKRDQIDTLASVLRESARRHRRCAWCKQDLPEKRPIFCRDACSKAFRDAKTEARQRLTPRLQDKEAATAERIRIERLPNGRCKRCGDDAAERATLCESCESWYAPARL